eukprot:1192442-Prorocentrum_minimum.AAC.5
MTQVGEAAPLVLSSWGPLKGGNNRGYVIRERLTRKVNTRTDGLSERGDWSGAWRTQAHVGGQEGVRRGSGGGQEGVKRGLVGCVADTAHVAEVLAEHAARTRELPKP